MSLVDNTPTRRISEVPGLARLVRSLLATAVLILLTATASLLAIALLAATLAQSRLSSVSTNGVNINIWKLDARSAEWQDATNKILERRRSLSAYDASRRDLAYSEYAAQAAMARAETRVRGALDYIAFRSAHILSDLAAEESRHDDKDITGRVGRIFKEEDKIRASLPTLEEPLAKLAVAYDDYRSAASDYNLSKLARLKLEDDLELGKKAVEDAEGSKTKLIESFVKTPDEATTAKLENAFHELTPNRGTIGWFLKYLITLQPDILSLLLVISMGVLGSSLQIAHSFFKAHRSESAGSYFLRLGVGAVTALAIFIIGKAGVPIFTDASKFGGDAPINPYFISFLAIVSGLLSERAIVSVQSYGVKLFGSGDNDTRRWVRFDLTPMLALEGVSQDVIVSHLNRPWETVSSVLVGREPATGEQQRTISMLLRTPLRDLFTDLPPTSGRRVESTGLDGAAELSAEPATNEPRSADTSKPASN